MDLHLLQLNLTDSLLPLQLSPQDHGQRLPISYECLGISKEI